jgi:PKD repeat protein
LIVPLIAVALTTNFVWASPTTLYIPDVIDLGLGIGDTFTIDIMVDEIGYPGLWGAQFELTFNSDVLQGVSKQVNLALLGSWGGTPLEVSGPGFNNTLGKLGLFSMFLLETGDEWVCPEIYAPDWLAKVTFQIVKLGESDIILGPNTGLKDPWGAEIPLDAMDDGYFRCVDSATIPQPSFTITPADYPLQGFNTTFEGTGNPAAGRSIVTYKWYFWRNLREELFWPIVTTQDTTQNYTVRGTWTVTLTAIDDTDVAGTTTGYVRIYSHDVAITAIQTNATQGEYPRSLRADIRDIVEVNVTAENQGDFPETFDVTAFWVADIAGEIVSGIIDTEPDVPLAAEANTTLTFYWDTEGRNITHPFTYGVRANASVVPDEWDRERGTGKMTDNEFIGRAHRIRFHDIAVISVSANATLVSPGDMVEIAVTVLNEGDFLEEDIHVTAYYDSTAIATQLIYQMHNQSYSASNLPGNHTATLTFLWDTTGVPPAIYTISAQATTVPDEYDTSDNTCVDGKVRWEGVPFAIFIYSPFEPVMGEIVTFNASLSYDEDGTIVSYVWDFGDDSYGEGMVTEHAYAADGTYIVSLTVTDNEGLSDTATEMVEVITPLPGMYLANLVKKSAWPGKRHFNVARHGRYNPLYGKVKNLGTSPVNVKVVFSIYNYHSGMFLDTLQTPEYELAVGEEHTLSADFDTDAFGTGKFYVEAQCWFDSNGNNTPDEPGEKIKTFAFAVVAGGGKAGTAFKLQ